MSQKHCVVVGGGLAGLAAAYRLRKKKWKVTLVEATERLGGRVKSYRFGMAPELVCELGGEWIGKNHTAMLQLCKDLGLKDRLVEHRYGNSFWNQGQPGKRYEPGAWCLSQEAKGIWLEFAKRFKHFTDKENQELDKVDWWTCLENLGFSREDLLRRDLMDSTDFGETIRMNSAYSAAAEYISTEDQDVDDTDEMDYKLEGGNEELVRALSKKIGRKNVLTDWEAKTIVQSAVAVRVFGKGQGPIDADACVFAAPAHWIGRIDWELESTGMKPDAAERIRAELRAKKELSKQLQYARITKTAVLCAERFWHRQKDYGYSVCTDLASDFVFDSTFGQDGTMGILCSYSIGDKADDIASAPAHDLKNWIVEDVSNANGCDWPSERIAKAALDIERQAWQEDVFTGGAYAFYRPGQWFTIREPLGAPVHRVFFAGEHIDENWQGFMEGAVRTGYQAAKGVDALFKPTHVGPKSEALKKS